MKTIDLKQYEHNTKVGKRCDYIEPNIKEDCFFKLDDEVIGFYINDISKVNSRLHKLLQVADKEFRSDNVPKSLLERSDVFSKVYKEGMTRSMAKQKGTVQMSAILGSVAPKPHMRRPYKTVSAVHRQAKAQTFIKAMWQSCIEAENIIKKLTPHIYNRQQKLFEQVDKKWKFGTMYTSSISNYNISAPYHKDTGNMKETVNIILTKRCNADGGCLNVPDYNVTFEQANNSMLVYPAWKNIHGVTPIKKHTDNGYRNSFIFYPLNAFTENEQK